MESQESTPVAGNREIGPSFQPAKAATPDDLAADEYSLGVDEEELDVEVSGRAAANERLVRRSADYFNARDFEGLGALYADDAELEIVSVGMTVQGSDAVRELSRGRSVAFPDGLVEVTAVLATDDGVVVEYTGRGTHTGPLSTPDGVLAPTGKPSETKFCRVCEIVDGRIQRVREYSNALATMRKLGTEQAHADAAQSNVALVRRVIDTWNARQWDEHEALYADDVEVLDVATGVTVHGPRAAREHTMIWVTAFPDAHSEIVHVTADANGAVAEFLGQGTHTGPLASPAGPIPATGRTGSLRSSYTFEIEDGKIKRLREYYDVATVLRQLGLMQ